VAKQLLSPTKLKFSGTGEDDYQKAAEAYINHQNRSKETALHVATKYAQLQMVLAIIYNN
jgi:hypothetical protein